MEKGVIDSSLPLAPEDTSWDSGEAIKAVKAWATEDGELNFSKYKKAFFYVDDGGGDKQGDFHLPFADIIGGDLKAVWKGVAAAMGALNGARGGDPVPEGDRKAVYHEIGTYYKRFGKDQPDLSKSITREVGERVDILCNFEPNSVKDLGNGSFSATVTTSDVDRMGESIDTQGISTDTFMQNPVVLYGHDYQGLPIGKATKVTSFKNKMTAQFQLAIAEYPFAATVAAMIKGGYLNAVSIGGIVKQWDETFTKIMQMEMVEFSVVPVPANPNALITASFEQATGKSAAAVAKEFHEFVNATMQKKLAALDGAELGGYIKTIEKLLAILKATADENAESTSEKEVVRITLRKTANEISRSSEEIIRFVKAKEKNVR